MSRARVLIAVRRRHGGGGKVDDEQPRAECDEREEWRDAEPHTATLGQMSEGHRH